MNELVSLYKILSDETRIRILALLYKQDLCVCELTELLDLSQPKISKHIAKIRSASLVDSKRNEQYIYYSFNHSNMLLSQLLELTLEHKNEQVTKDLDRLKNKGQFVCTKVGK